MVRIGSINGTIRPAVPWLEFYAGQTSTATVSPDWNNIMWEYWQDEQLVICTSDFEYQTDDVEGRIKVNTSGLYLITLELGFTDGQKAAYVLTRFLINGDEIVGTRASASISAQDKLIYITSSRTLYIEAGDILTFQYTTDSDSVSFTDNNHGRLRIQFIPMLGWNNNTGGSVVNRGIRR